jgi:3-isopropylmalate/(R)-2-methylmalate dehydratase small subunit
MAQFSVLTAVAAPIVTDNVDTDQIFPSRFSSKDRADGKFGTYFLHDQRFDADGGRNGAFILNDERLRDARIIVAAANYACGSARPGAIYSHLDYGIEAIIAESFGPVFPTVAYKSGLLTIQLPAADTAYIRDRLLASLGAQVTIDLQAQRVVAPDGKAFAFEMDHFVKRMFVEGISEIDLTLGYQPKIEVLEARLRSALPWVYERH